MQNPFRRERVGVHHIDAPARAGYALHGLRIVSEVPLPLQRLAGTAHADVSILRQSVPLAGEVVWRSTVPPRCTCLRDGSRIILAWDGARFGITPERIAVDSGRDDATLQLLIQPVWAVLLTARGREAIHASAVERDGRAIAVAGATGSGKSTAALTLIDAGWRLLTDDLLTFNEQGLAYPGPPYMRLRSDRATSRDGEWDQMGKLRHVPASCPAPVCLSTLIILDEQFARVQPLTGLQAADALLRDIYNPILTHPGQAAQRLDFVMRLARGITIVGAPPRSLTPAQLVRLAQQGEA